MTLTFDETLDALGDVKRRRLLVGLLDHNPQQADSESYGEPGEAPEEGLQAMVHVHLPKLERYGCVEWDRRTRDVAKGPNFEDIRPVLELLEAHDDELPPGWR